MELKKKVITEAIVNKYGVKTKGFYYADIKNAVNKDNEALNELKEFFKAELDNDGFQKLTLSQVIEHLEIYEEQKKEIFGDKY